MNEFLALQMVAVLWLIAAILSASQGWTWLAAGCFTASFGEACGAVYIFVKELKESNHG